MVTSARDLLDQAQAEAWALAAGVTLDRHTNYAGDSWEELRALAPEWPRLAAGAATATREALGLHPSAPATTRSLQLLEQTTQEQVSSSILPSRHVHGRLSTETQTRTRRLSELLHATGDLLASARQRGDFTSRHEAEAAEISDRIARTTAAVATVTQIHLERVSQVGIIEARRHFAELAQATPRHQAPRDPQLLDALELIAVAAPAEATLEAAVNRWEDAARGALEQPVPDPGALRHIAIDAAGVNAARAAVLQHPTVLGPTAVQNSMAHRSSARARAGWVGLADAWPSHIRGAGRADVTAELREASAGLRAQLRPLRDGSHPDPSSQLTALTRALRPVSRVGEAYRAAVGDAIGREVLLVPARRLARESLSADPRLAADSQRGRWVRLPKHDSAAQGILGAARDAERLARQAAEETVVRGTNQRSELVAARPRSGPRAGPSAGVER